MDTTKGMTHPRVTRFENGSIAVRGAYATKADAKKAMGYPLGEPTPAWLKFVHQSTIRGGEMTTLYALHMDDKHTGRYAWVTTTTA